MSKNISIRFLVVLPVLAFLAVTFAAADLGVLAQNTNSSTPTPDESMQHENMNMNAGPRRGRRRGRRTARRPAPGGANLAVDPSESPAAATGAAPQETDTGVGSPGEATDLSGTWTGRVRMSGGHEMQGEGTLTITGNQFTLAVEGMSHTGRVIAITTRGYTGASFIFSDMSDPVSNTPLACSVRVRKSRNTLTLTPVPAARNRFNFVGRAGS